MIPNATKRLAARSRLADEQALRIAFTGHRPHRLAARPVVLRMRLRRALARLARKARPQSCVLETALAEGADQTAAYAAFSLGVPVRAVLPAEPRIYVRTFRRARSRRVFAHILVRCAEVEILKSSGRRRPDYVALGVRLVSQADHLLAVHDGARSGGPGGVADVIETARSRGVPVTSVRP